MAAAVTGTIGLAAALFARPGIGLFTDDAEAIAAGARYPQLAGPAYAPIGLGLALSFATQGARPMRWSMVASVGRAVTVAAVAALAGRIFGPGAEGVAVAVIAALAVYAITHAMPWLPRQAWRDAESAP
jgi:Na+-driven multidrug efflux pump